MRQEILEDIKEIKAREYNCTTDLFSDRKNAILKNNDSFFKMISFGMSTVIAASNTIFPEISKLLYGEEGIFCFDAPKLCEIDNILKQYQYKIGEINDYFIPSEKFQHFLKSKNQYKIIELNKNEIKKIDNVDAFENALCIDNMDINEFAFAAYDNSQIIAMSGVSSNSDKLWWVGVDTIPEYRNKGLASFLVSMVSAKTIEKGKIPIYPTWYSNIGSRITAINAGYKPGFVEISAEEL